MFISSNMSLTIWDTSEDFYNHAQLGQNFKTLDTHDHTLGHGVQIKTGSIENGAITSSLLASGAVDTAAIADGAVTAEKLATAPFSLGTVIQWWRPTPQVDIPAGWVIPAGQALDATQHDYGPIINPANPTSVSITLPDLRNRFVLGASTGVTGPDPGSAPAIGQTGGANTANLAHQHLVNGRYIVSVGENKDKHGLLIRNWEYFGWPWGTFWWGYSAEVQTDSQLSQAQDIRPSYVGLLMLMKVKNA